VAKFTLYAKKVYYYRKEINARDRKTAEKRCDQYESERLFIPTGEEFYITSIEENEDDIEC
jgi:hypothetical protein